jgi:hypothetical protein
MNEPRDWLAGLRAMLTHASRVNSSSRGILDHRMRARRSTCWWAAPSSVAATGLALPAAAHRP